MIEKNHQKHSLYVHEWLAIVSVLFVFVILTVVSHSCYQEKISETSVSAHQLINSEITVQIEGEVEFPGKYQMKKGAKLKELIELAKPTPIADLKRVKQEAVLRKGQRIKIKSLELVQIILELPDGIHEEIAVPKGTKLQDLASVHTFGEDIEIVPLQKKRALRNGEIVKTKFRQKS